MTENSNDSAKFQTPSLPQEETTAKAILAWLDAQTLYQHYYDLIRDLNGLDGYDFDATRSLRFNLWMASNASLWRDPCPIKSSNDLLWQMAIIRLSCRLNTGHW